MKTYEKLAEELNALGLTEMAKKAGEGYYHDYLSPLALPTIVLVQHLADASKGAPNYNEIVALRNRVIDGDFDADLAESDEWAASPDGQDAFKRLASGK